MLNMASVLQEEFSLKPFQVTRTIQLIEDNNTIPFIARYRKELTGGLSDEILRDFFDRFQYLKNLVKRKKEIQDHIEKLELLTPEIMESLIQANTLQEVEDLYRPFRPKKRTRATIAKAQGLYPFSQILLEQKIGIHNIDNIAHSYLCPEKKITQVSEVFQGAMDIIAEQISENPIYRKKIRNILLEEGLLFSKAKVKEITVYSQYYDYKEPLKKWSPIEYSL